MQHNKHAYANMRQLCRVLGLIPILHYQSERPWFVYFEPMYRCTLNFQQLWGAGLHSAPICVFKEDDHLEPTNAPAPLLPSTNYYKSFLSVFGLNRLLKGNNQPSASISWRYHSFSFPVTTQIISAVSNVSLIQYSQTFAFLPVNDTKNKQIAQKSGYVS